MPDLHTLVEEIERGEVAELYRNENGELFLMVPFGTEQDPDSEAYVVDAIEGRLSHVGGE